MVQLQRKSCKKKKIMEPATQAESGPVPPPGGQQVLQDAAVSAASEDVPADGKIADAVVFTAPSVSDSGSTMEFKELDPTKRFGRVRASPYFADFDSPLMQKALRSMECAAAV